MDKLESTVRKLLVIPPQYLNSGFRFNIKLVGVGGTGSHILEHLVRVHFAMVELGLAGLMVVAYDDDDIEPHNLVRQRFLLNEIGMKKSEALIHRINTTYGLDWISVGTKCKSEIATACNILITATDSGFFRNDISRAVKDIAESKVRPHMIEHTSSIRLLAWIDAGNEQKSGQVIITDGRLPTPVDINKKPFEVDRLPGSCSAEESLTHQDLFVNSMAGVLAANTIWNLIRHRSIDYHAIWFNVSTNMVIRSKISSLNIPTQHHDHRRTH